MVQNGDRKEGEKTADGRDRRSLIPILVKLKCIPKHSPSRTNEFPFPQNKNEREEQGPGKVKETGRNEGTICYDGNQKS